MAQLRTQNATANLPIVLLSADAISEQIKSVKRVGANDYLTKPLDIAQFRRTLESYVSDVG